MKKAFTLVELVLVVVVVGIISAAIVPRLNRSTLDQAADQIISHIRYTQHLALMDDKFDPKDPTWFKERWQLSFSRSVDSQNVWAYAIFSDMYNHDGSANLKQELARDPMNPGSVNAAGQIVASSPGQYLSGGISGILHLSDSRRSKKMNLYETYHINWVSFSRSCSTKNPGSKNQSRRIIFDSVGRPYYYYKKDKDSLAANPYSDMRLIKSQCIITLYENADRTGNSVQIAIEPETGYTHKL